MKAGINVHFEGIRDDGGIDGKRAHGHNFDEFRVGNPLGAEGVIVGRGQAGRVRRAAHGKVDHRAGARRFNGADIGLQQGQGGGVHAQQRTKRQMRGRAILAVAGCRNGHKQHFLERRREQAPIAHVAVDVPRAFHGGGGVRQGLKEVGHEGGAFGAAKVRKDPRHVPLGRHVVDERKGRAWYASPVREARQCPWSSPCTEARPRARHVRSAIVCTSDRRTPPRVTQQRVMRSVL